MLMFNRSEINVFKRERGRDGIIVSFDICLDALHNGVCIFQAVIYLKGVYEGLISS